MINETEPRVRHPYANIERDMKNFEYVEEQLEFDFGDEAVIEDLEIIKTGILLG